ncbi:site-specific integrase [Lysobacter capsici]|uniref:site-specific integrase n=1 Tax=Lysobacter capsici TaxID=435897 RepID=UPI0009E9628D|nr:site-specific integrase [Lysobacter capsici]
MPKPALLVRPSGLYVRFLVPVDLRACVGSRFIVRSLGGRRGDHARLAAACCAMALSEAFDALRRGPRMVDFKKLLEGAQQAADDGSVRDWTATGLKVGKVDFGTVTTSGPEDTADFLKVFEAAVLAAEGRATAPASAQSSTPAPISSAPLLSAEIANHIADLERRKLSPDTITESKHTLRLFLALAGDVPIDKIKAPHIRFFWNGVRWWPANATVKPAYKGLSIHEIIERGKAEDVPAPSTHTLNKHRQRLSVFFNGLVDTDLIAKSPLKGMGPEIDTSTDLDTGRPFTDQELQQIFDPSRFLPWAQDLPHRWWGPMLGLYTGARVNEVAQLYLDDVRQVKGVWGVFFWKNARAQKIKTQSSIRFVPLAQPLLDAGFLEFVEDMRRTGHPRLFPHLPAGTSKSGKPNGTGYGRQLSRQFAAYLKTFGMEKGVAFHAFRHTLSTKLTEADVDINIIAMLTGHARKQQVPVLETHYIHIADTKTLMDRFHALTKFNPSLTLAKYRGAQFAASLGDPSSLHQ